MMVLFLNNLYKIYSLAEIPECAVKIASNEVVLNQLVATLSCPSYNHFDHLVSTGGMLCLSFKYDDILLAYQPSLNLINNNLFLQTLRDDSQGHLVFCYSCSTSTHPYLSSKPVLSGILKCCTTSNCELLR